YQPQQLTGTSHVVPSGKLVAGEKYRWNMQAHNNCDWSAISNTRYFQTAGAPPSAPTITSPGASTEPSQTINTLTPTLQWSDVANADYYAIAISEYPYGATYRIYNLQKVYGTSHQVPTGYLFNGKKYRWQMQAYNSAGWSNYSNILYFQIPSPTVTLTLYIHEGSADGPVLSGVQVTGKDGGDNSFNQTTNVSGYVTITGVSGTWQFTASKSGYQTATWSNEITKTQTRYVCLVKSTPGRLISISSPWENFGNVTVGQPRDEIITIANESSSTENLTGSLAISGECFSIVSGDGSFNLSPGQSRQVTVRFSPTSAKSYPGQLSITHNATNQTSPLNISLSGVGASISPNQPPIAVIDSPLESKSGELIIFDASRSYDPDGNIDFYEWDLNNDGLFEEFTIFPVAKCQWNKAGTYTVALRVKDNRDAKSETTKRTVVIKDSVWDKVGDFSEDIWPWGEKVKKIEDNELSEIKQRLGIDGWLPSTGFHWATNYDLKEALNWEIDSEKVPGLTYGIYILNAIKETDMMKDILTQEYKRRYSEYFSNWLELNTGWSGVAKFVPNFVFKQTLLNVTGKITPVGGNMLSLALTSAELGELLVPLKKLYLYNTLWSYLDNRRNSESHENAWENANSDPVAGNYIEALYKIKLLNVEKYRKIKELFNDLWNTYEQFLTNEYPYLKEEAIQEELRSVFLSALKKYRLPDRYKVTMKSPCELRIYDSQGQITGLVNGEIREEVSNSVYDEENKVVMTFFPIGSYRYEVVGTGLGIYGLTAISVTEGTATAFTATNIPTSANAVHQYTIDWDILSQGGIGTTIQIDSEGDGNFEKSISSGNELNGLPDEIPPAVTITSPNLGNNTTVSQSPITISGTTSDTGSGVTTISISTGQENTGDTVNFSFLVELEPDTNTFIVTATDNAGNTGTDTIAIIYNAAPIFSPIGDQVVNEGDTLTFVVTASDSNSQDHLTYSASNLPEGANFDTSTQVFTWVTDYDDSGVYANVAFTVNDGRGGSDSETISITVGDVNRPPVLTPIGNKSVNEGDTLTFEVTASDSDTGDTISYTAQQSLPDGATFGNPTFTWTPGYDQAGTYPVTFIATDTQGDSDSETITITVNNINLPPVLDHIADITVNEGQTITIPPTASDPDGDSLTFSYSDWMSADTYTTTYDDAGTYTVIVTVSDGELSDSQAVTITVNNVNRCPILAEIGNRSVNEGSLLTIDLTCSDSDNDPLVFSIEGLPAGATFIDNGDTTATFSWTPGYGNSANYEVSFAVSDGACTDQEDIIISVGDVNRPPVLDLIADITVNEGQTITIAPTASDPDGDSLTFSYSDWMNSSTYTTDYDDAGTHTVIITVSDGDLSDSQEVTIVVNNTNRPPVLASIGNKSVNEGDVLAFEVIASDSDTGDPLSYTAQPLPDGASFGNPAFTWTPGYDQAGTYPVTFIATDNYGGSDSEIIIITVNNVNRPPVLNPIVNIIINEGQTVTITPTASDPDGDSLTFSCSGWMNSSAYTTTYNDAGTHTVIVAVSDGELSDSQEVTVIVNNVNRPPVLAPIGNKSVNEGDSLTFELTASDSDTEDTISYTARPLPTGASFGNPTFTWTPGYNQAGTYPVTFIATDTQGDSDSETIIITVNNINRCPILAEIENKTINEGQTLTFSVTASDSDNDPLVFSPGALPEGAN
ncbi:tandem-95 repeat protein, partial [Patescibacteria group bacterium]|nr:tandem-95 repeat protein [Patescibacteria group bacterium]